MGIYACPRCGNPNGWWSGNMRDVHDCPGPPRRQWPGQPPEFDWAELDEQPTNGVVVDRALNTTPVANQKPANLIDNADGVGTLARCAHHPSKCPHWEDCRARQECVGALGVPAVPASGPLRDLGAYLARVLDEDQWAHAEALLLKATDGVKESGRGQS